MSNKHKNYNQYYGNKGNQNQPKVENKPVAEETVTPVVKETIVENITIVEPAETLVYADNGPETYTVDLTTAMDNTEDNLANPWVAGVVNGCVKLNIRQAPDSEAPVVTVINAGTVVQIFTELGTKDFYNVRIESGETGYCMKKFIKVDSK